MNGEQDSSEDGAEEIDYTSPTIDYLQQALGQTPAGPEIACVDCPSGLWFWQDDNALTCFCTALHRDTWTAGTKAILYCDGREQARAKLAHDRQRP